MKYAKVSTRETTGPQLFNIAKDPSEKTNLAEAHPDKVEAMQKLADEARTHLEQDDPWPEGTETRTTESLDYVTPATALYLGR